MNKKLGMAGLLAVVLGVVGITVYVYQQEAIATTKTIVSEEVALNLSILPEESINRIEISGKDGVTLERTKDEWTNSDYKEVAYNEDMIEDWIKYFTNVQSISVCRKVEDLTPYGIGEESKTITFYDEEGNHQTFRVGSSRTDVNALYMSSDETELVYSVNLEEAAPVFSDPAYFIDTEMGLPALETVKKMEFKLHKNNPIILTKNNAEWILTGYYHDPRVVDETVMTSLMNELSTLKKESFVGETSETETYGLDDPYLSIIFDDHSKVTFGKKDNNSIYFTLNDEPFVYKMSQEAISYVEALKPLEMIKKQVYQVASAEIKSITLTNPQAIFELKINEETDSTQEVVQTEVASEQTVEAKQVEEVKELVEKEQASVEKTVMEEAPVATLNDKVLEQAKAEELVDLIGNSVCIEAALQNPQMEIKGERKAEITIVYALKNGTTKKIELLPYDINFYILRLDDQIEFAVNKEKVTALFSQLGQIVKA